MKQINQVVLHHKLKQSNQVVLHHELKQINLVVLLHFTWAGQGFRIPG